MGSEAKPEIVSFRQFARSHGLRLAHSLLEFVPVILFLFWVVSCGGFAGRSVTEVRPRQSRNELEVTLK